MSSRKQKALDKKRRPRQLKKRLKRASFLPPDATIIYDPPGAAKMSEVLWDFVAPYQDSAPTEENLRNLLTLATVAWNAALVSPAEREELIRETEKALPAELRLDYRAILEPLLRRKQEYFADNRRMILGFELTMGPAGPYLQVMSTLGV